MDAPVPTPQALTCSQLMLSVGTTCRNWTRGLSNLVRVEGCGVST